MNDSLLAFLNEKAVYLETERKKALRYNILYIYVANPLKKLLKFPAILLLVICAFLPFLLPTLIIVGGLFLLASLVPNPKVTFENRLKDEILPEIFKQFRPDFEYKPYFYNKASLEKSSFFDKNFFSKFTKIEGDDYVKGSVENVAVEFFEIRFYKETINYLKSFVLILTFIVLLPIAIIRAIFTNDDDVATDLDLVVKEEVNYFSGFFMHADFHKDFSGKVILVPNNMKSYKDRFMAWLNSDTLSQITLENPFMNEQYGVYASDPQTGYYVLSTNLVERIHQLSVRENGLPIISFINGKMFAALPLKKNYFDVNLKIKVTDASYFLPYLKEIESFENLVKELNLNTRIWSKI
ncbi:DUF3137 domain-containing protein [Flavobacterium pedocola]